MTVLGIVVALKGEARCLVRMPLTKGECHRHPEGPLIHVSGMGHERAAQAAKLLTKKGATALLSWGCAGGLHAQLRAGSLILPKQVLSCHNTSFSVHALWHKRLCERLHDHTDIHTGPLIESRGILKRANEKSALREAYGAAAVDMESAAVARVASGADIPFMAVRAVLDPADMTLPASALNATDAFGSVHPLQLTRNLFRNPAEILFLIHLGRCFRAARNTLETVVCLTGPTFLVP